MANDVTPSDLVVAARAARDESYAPYSKFRAGAAVVAGDGTVVTGALVENVSLGLAMCAERVALFSLVTAGRRPEVLALVAPTTGDDLTWPCGACLQVALELGGPDLVVVVSSDDEGSPIRDSTVKDLLPKGPYIPK